MSRHIYHLERHLDGTFSCFGRVAPGVWVVFACLLVLGASQEANRETQKYYVRASAEYDPSLIKVGHTISTDVSRYGSDLRRPQDPNPRPNFFNSPANNEIAEASSVRDETQQPTTIQLAGSLCVR